MGWLGGRRICLRNGSGNHRTGRRDVHGGHVWFFLIHAGIAASYLKSKTPDTSSDLAQRAAREGALTAELRLAGLEDDADLHRGEREFPEDGAPGRDRE